MTRGAKISVVIPVYRAEKYIARCIESVCRQTYADLEIIVVNDCTPDRSMETVRLIARHEPRLIIVENPRNMGAMVAREKGCEAATGDMLCFLDSDDYMVTDAIERLLARYEATGADIVSAGLVLHRANGSDLHFRSRLPYGGSSEGVQRAVLTGQFPASLCAKLFTRRLFADFEYQVCRDMSISEDVSLLHQLIENARGVAVVDEEVYHCEDNPGSSTHVKYGIVELDSILTGNDIKLRICGKYPSLNADLDRFLTFTVLRLFANDVPLKDVWKLVKKHRQERYASLRHAFRVLTPRRFWGTLAAICLCRMR